MSKINHVFIEHNGQCYEDYIGLYLDGKYETYNLGLDGTYFNKLSDGYIDKLLDKNFVVQPKSEIHVVAGCPFAMQDIRNNYKVKRGFDEGCCNIFSPMPWVSNRWLDGFVIFPQSKIIVLIPYYSHIKQSEWLQKACESAGKDNNCLNETYTMYQRSYVVHITNKSPEYVNLLTGNYKKPCVSYKKLQMTNVNELTVDILQIVYNAARLDYSQKNLDNLKTQLMMLNQHNWRDYPGTMSILFGDILRNTKLWGRLKCTPSQQPKPIKQLMDFVWKEQDIKDAKDYEMAHSFVDAVLGVGEGKYPTFENVCKKINDSGINLRTFSMIYNTMVRITPKRYGE